MRVVRRKDDLIKVTQEARSSGKLVGFVPTMGALHMGHLSLLSLAQKQTKFTVCSIFVNPTQFNNASDLEHYPRTEEADLALLEEKGCDLVFIPEVSEMYPANVQADHYDLGELENRLEGAHRPNHFQGVCTIVERLLRLVNPDHAFFGEKDFQQLAVIRKMVSLKKLPVTIHGGPTLREPNGLAMSSRNQRLTEDQRNRAKVIHEQMKWMADNAHQTDVKTLLNRASQAIEKEADFEVEYLAIADANTLETLVKIEDSQNPHIFAAVNVKDVRLIDNLSIN
ncbi:MAG: pantoate--beta-alanine ligase [Schleiferiaceae bacterium]